MELQMTQDAVSRSVEALLNDNATFGGSGAGHNRTVTPGSTIITPGDETGFTACTFNGSLPLTAGLGFEDGTDPLIGTRTMTLLAPAGGYRWVANGPENLPQTINSIRIVNQDTGEVLAIDNLPDPITLTSEGDQANIGTLQIVPRLQ